MPEIGIRQNHSKYLQLYDTFFEKKAIGTHKNTDTSNWFYISIPVLRMSAESGLLASSVWLPLLYHRQR